MNILHVKENINMDEVLPTLGFTKARDYFHYEGISIRICDRAVVISTVVPALRHTSERKFPIPSALLKLINEGWVE